MKIDHTFHVTLFVEIVFNVHVYILEIKNPKNNEDFWSVSHTN